MKHSFFRGLRALANLLILTALLPLGVLAQGLILTTDSEEAKEAFLEGLQARQSGDTEQGRAAFARALKLDPNFVVARVMDLHADREIPLRGRYHQMGESIDDMAGASTSELLLVLAYRQWLSGNVDGDWENANRAANRLFDALRSIVPDSPEAAYGYANSRVAWVFGLDEEIAALREAVERFPEYAPPRNLLAYRLADRGDLGGAREQVTRFLELAPDSPNAHDSFAEIMAWSGLSSESMKHYRRAVDMGRGSSLIGIASLQQRMGNGEAARETLLSHLSSTDNPFARLQAVRALAFSHLRDGQIEEGRARLREVASVGVESGYDGWAATAYGELALFDAMMGDGQKVDDYLEQASTLALERYNSWSRTCAYALAGRRAEAWAATRANFEAWPDDKDATWRNTLEALVRLNEGDVEGATQSLMKSNLGNPWALALMAIAKRQAGESEVADALELEVRGSRRMNLLNSDRNVSALLLDYMKVEGGSY